MCAPWLECLWLSCPGGLSVFVCVFVFALKIVYQGGHGGTHLYSQHWEGRVRGSHRLRWPSRGCSKTARNKTEQPYLKKQINNKSNIFFPINRGSGQHAVAIAQVRRSGQLEFFSFHQVGPEMDLRWPGWDTSLYKPSPAKPSCRPCSQLLKLSPV